MDDQLPLFDWPAMVMGEGYRRLAAFRFDEAGQHFRDVLHAGQGEEEELTKALHVCKYWQALVQQNKEDPGTYSIDELYEEWEQECTWPKIWLQMCLKASKTMPKSLFFIVAMLVYLLQRLRKSGVIVALANARENYHYWSKLQTADLSYPFYTCEPVLSESFHLLQAIPKGTDTLLGGLEMTHSGISKNIPNQRQPLHIKHCIS